MSEDRKPTRTDEHEAFVREAQGERTGLLAEFWDFLKHNKKWWLLPMLIVFALAAALMLLATNPATAPFLYPLF
jgi:hypothetical protein